MTGRAFVRFSIMAALLVATATLPVAWRLGGIETVWGVLWGCALGVGNLAGMAWLLGRLLYGKGTKNKGAWTLLLGTKLTLFMGLAWVVIQFAGAEPIGFLLGFTAVVLGLFCGGVRVAIEGMANEDGAGGD